VRHARHGLLDRGSRGPELFGQREVSKTPTPATLIGLNNPGWFAHRRHSLCGSEGGSTKAFLLSALRSSPGWRKPQPSAFQAFRRRRE